MRTTTVVLALLTCGADALVPQRARHYEIGAFGAFTRYADAFAMEDKVGGGIRFGYAFSDRLGLEAEVLFQPRHAVPGTSSGFEPLIGGASLVVNVVELPRNSFYLVGGYSLLDFGNVAPYRFTDHGVHAGAGDRLFLGDRVALRVEARGIRTLNTKGAFGVDAVTHFVATAGLSVFQSAGPPRPRLDADRDGVEDRRDACPDTPLGAVVDRRGCPSDSDGDRVFNGIDQCADTPAGASVNALGCPSDADADKVLDGVDRCPDTPAGATVDTAGCPSDADGDKVFDGIDRCPDTPAGATVDGRGCPLDSDADTVFDGLDKCPGTPAGTAVDVDGCPPDADRDGVANPVDQCPDTPPGTTVDARGCPPDTDGDGVPDVTDRCPGTPPGTEVDATGCPLSRDTDGDGVPDPRDRCPGTPAGTQVDAQGCQVLFREERGRTVPLVLAGVRFQTGRSVILPTSYATLDQVAASLVANADVRIEISGHTDNTGSAALNQRLSQARADAVRAYLARRGVSPSRMVSRGYGPTRPVAPNTTPQGRAQNRRVELNKLP